MCGVYITINENDVSLPINENDVSLLFSLCLSLLRKTSAYFLGFMATLLSFDPSHL
jgi:hypothetical protein